MAEQSSVIESPDFDAPDEFNRISEGEQSFEGADGVAPGMGQSKSSRRRRRKRKGKLAPGGAPSEDGGSSEGGDSAPAITPMEGESLSIAATSANGNGQPRSAASQNGQQPQGAGQGKRWKKKFRDRERRPRSENPGNDFRAESSPAAGGQNGYAPQNGGGFKRKGKQQQGGRRERGGFVGPMDHSYREANGNFADPSASTISIHGGGGRRGRHHGDSQPIDHSMPRAIPIPEHAQTHIYFFIEDLFITAKIQETARKQGVKIAFMKNEKEALAELMEDKETDKPALIVFDLNNANAKPMTLIPKLKAKFKRSCSIVGFLSHLQGDLKAKATEVGCDAVMPRAAFSQNLPNLLRRYSMEDGEEENFNR
jgi:hypothetical protein